MPLQPQKDRKSEEGEMNEEGCELKEREGGREGEGTRGGVRNSGEGGFGPGTEDYDQGETDDTGPLVQGQTAGAVEQSSPAGFAV